VAQRSIDLLPEIPEEEVKEIKQRGRLNLFGVFSIFVVGLATLVILVLTLAARIDYNSKNQRLADTSSEIKSLQYIELKQNTFNTKVDTYTSVQKHDFSSDVILDYLMEVAGRLSVVGGMYLDDSMGFRLTGSADSYMNVARIWHNMAENQDYFEFVNLNSVGREDGTFGGSSTVLYVFEGKMIRDNVGNLE
jgi:hypothetical protein